MLKERSGNRGLLFENYFQSYLKFLNEEKLNVGYLMLEEFFLEKRTKNNKI